MSGRVWVPHFSRHLAILSQSLRVGMHTKLQQRGHKKRAHPIKLVQGNRPHIGTSSVPRRMA